jgi:Raf kinase inhibitor-like YbhB/YbcL family protein
MTLVVSSWAFALEDLPVEFSGDGRNVSPPLEWTAGPEGTRCYALIFDDPDGPRGIWVHWVAWNIRDRKLHENVLKQSFVETPEGRVCQGRNSFNRVGYTGPCPPSGTHRYFFKVYALDTELDLGPDTTKATLLDAMEGHILDVGELMVTYSQARAAAERRTLGGLGRPTSRPVRP